MRKWVERMISIIIVGYNSERFLKKCLDSVYAQGYKDFEVIFVNNGSSDDSRAIAELYPNLRVINNAVNMGFAFAVNQAIAASRGDYVLSLNSDVVLDGDFLIEIEKAAESSHAALFGVKILNYNNKRIDSTGLVLSRLYRFFDRGRGKIDKGQYDKSFDIFGPCAAAALYKREMLEDIRYKEEYFDNDFFFLAEDFDIAWRALKKGWEARFIASAVCYHVRNSTNFNDKFRQYLSFRNRYFLLIKNAKFDLRYLFAFLLYDIPRLVYMLFTNSYTLKALYEIIRYGPRMLRKRFFVKPFKKRPHILNIIHRYHPAIGGAEIYMKEVSERLVRSGYDVSVFTTDACDLEHFWKRGKRRVKNLREINSHIKVFRFRVVKFPLHSILMRLLYHLPLLFFKAMFSLPSPIVPGMWMRLFFDERIKFDAVHISAFPYNSLMYMGIKYAERHGIPVVATPFLHLGEYKNDSVSKYYTRRFQIRLLSRCDKVIVQTEIEREYLKKFGINEEKIYLVGQGVNLKDIQGGIKERFRRKYKIKEPRIIFNVSSKFYDKGTFHIVEAMKEIWKYDKGVRLILAGPPMDAFDRYFSAQNIFVKEKTLILDHVAGEDKKDLFAAGDVFVMPSRTDSFGAVYLESWSNKKPVIGAEAGGVPEVIRHGEDGYLVKFGNIAQLSTCMKELLYNEDLAREMGEKGYSKVVNGLTWDARFDVFKRIFQVLPRG